MVSGAKIEWWGDLLPITLSIGGTEVRKGDREEEVLHRAEAGMRQSRAQGGDRAILEQEE